jgi:hypothetical protein
MAKLLDKFRMTAEDRKKFYEFLDKLPEADRVIYAFHGNKSSAWQKLGGGTSHLIGLFYADRLVLTTRGMVKVSEEKDHKEYPLAEIKDVAVHSGPLTSTVTLQLQDGSKTKFGNVSNAVAQPLTSFMSEGLAAFDRSHLDDKTFNEMFFSYVLAGSPLPEFLKRHGHKDVA